MNPVEISQGKSFKGLATYLLHDPQRAETSERVGWAQTYNLADAAPDDAWRLMMATANSANALKEVAGIKKGKAVNNTVYHYSINFHPDDKLTNDIRRAAVEGSLKALGLQDHQALAVEHTDKAHNHLHIMVNLIDPSNGMSAATPVMGDDGKKRSKLSHSQRKLSAWAGKFERDHRLEIVEGRLANANKRAQGEQVNAKRKRRNVRDQEVKEKPVRRRRDFGRQEFEDRAKDIQSRSAKIRDQSSIEWEALKESYKVEKSAIKDQMSPTMKGRSEEIKRLFTPYWANMFERQRNEVKAFEVGDRTTLGKIWHGAAAFRHLAVDGDYLGGFLAAFSKQERLNIVLKKHDREREEMRKRLMEQIAQELGKLKRDFDRQFSQARERFSDRCDKLKRKEGVSWSEIREAWQSYNDDRSAAFVRAKSRHDQVVRQMARARGRGMEPE